MAARAASARGGARTPAAERATAQATRADLVDFSESARSLAAARQVVDRVPDVRTDRVEAIKTQLENGTYQVSADVLAYKLLGIR